MAELRFKKFEEQVFFSTIRIERPKVGSMGTGFLLSVPAPDGQHYIFLVSNKHVLDDPKQETRLVFHTEDNEGNPILGETFKVNIKEFIAGYYSNEDPDSDIALLNISEIYTLATTRGKKIHSRPLKLENLLSDNDNSIFAGSNIVFIGYPNDRYDTANFLPILRGGSIASIPSVDFENKPHMLVDAQVFPGSSGSPVFTIVDNYWMLIGVICQTMIQNQRVDIIETSITGAVNMNLGIGIVIKSRVVRELIEEAVNDLNKINKFA